MASELFFVFISSKRLLTADLDILVILDIRMSPGPFSRYIPQMGGGGAIQSAKQSLYSLLLNVTPRQRSMIECVG
jgi:hypothetical protein